MSTSRTAVQKNNSVAEIARISPILLDRPFSKEEFQEISGNYPELQMEREMDGKIRIMSPVKAGSGSRESKVILFLGIWWFQTRLGEIFSASTGIELPDGSIKSPDCAWLSPERLALIRPGAREEEFLQVVPDFIVEVRSKSDSINRLKEKMTESWIKNGVRLAWLIDPFSEKTWIYRESGEVELVEGFVNQKLSGENILPGMELPLDELKIISS